MYAVQDSIIIIYTYTHIQYNYINLWWYFGPQVNKLLVVINSLQSKDDTDESDEAVEQ